jgi:hypothetical protein
MSDVPFYFSELANPTAGIAGQVAGSSAVPEPGTLGILALASLSQLCRRRRKRL